MCTSILFETKSPLNIFKASRVLIDGEAPKEVKSKFYFTSGKFVPKKLVTRQNEETEKFVLLANFEITFKKHKIKKGKIYCFALT